MLRLLLSAATAVLLAACLREPDPGSLTALSNRPSAGMDCTACHAYVLQDPDHVVHIGQELLSVKTVNGPVTCLDCHRNSMQYVTVIMYDSIYVDSNGVERSTIDFANDRAGITGTLARIDTLVQHHPIASRQPGSPTDLQQWMTGLAHLNGKVDVDFDSAVSDPARFQGARAAYDPKMETCSAVRCHGWDGPYRFEACGKGLGPLKGEPGNPSTCIEGP